MANIKIDTIRYESNLQIGLIETNPKINVRTEKINLGLEDLKKSIGEIGLIEPIMVSEVKKGQKYVLIVGQRRLLAFKELRKKTIPARIIKPVDILTAQIISFGENLQRRDLTTPDKKKFAEYLFKKYKGTKERKIRKISQDLSIPIYNVISYLQDEAVPEEALKIVKEARLAPQKAWQITAALLGKAEKIIEVVKEMAKTQMTDPERANIIKTAKKNPNLPVDAIIEKSKEPGTIIDIKLHLDLDTWKKLNEQSKTSGYENAQEFINKIIDNYLEDEGLK